MICRKMERLIVDYLAGELSPVEKEALEKHLSTCATCSSNLKETRQVLTVSREASVPQLPDYFWERQREKLGSFCGFPRVRRRSILVVSSALALVCLLVVFQVHRSSVLAKRLPHFLPGGALLPSEEGILELADAEEPEPDYLLNALLKK